MQIKDASGNVIAEVDLKDGFSIQELVKTLSNKRSGKSSFDTLKSVEESENKKQIVFRFNDGEIFYDLPKKVFVRSNGSVIGENSFRSIRLNLDNKVEKYNNHYWTVDDFWLKVAAKTDSAWIKTFFKLVDIWANKKYKNGTYLNSRDRQTRNKLKILIEDKNFFDSIELFSKIPQFQSFSDAALEGFYTNLLEITQQKNRNYNYNFDKINFDSKKNKLDAWLLNNMDIPVSEVYVECEEVVLSDYVGDYLRCCESGLRDEFRYVFTTYRGVILNRQIDKIKNLIKYGYDSTRLMDYLYRDIYNQGSSLELDSSWNHDCGALSTLLDYAKMNHDMRRDYEKYPRYLSTFHDVTAKNYKLEEDKIAKEKFNKVIKNLNKQNFEYSSGDYSVILPRDAKCLVEEGQSLSHCVASYYKRMAQGETIIAFLRKTKSIKDSLVTIEICEKDGKKYVAQAKGKSNSAPKPEEMNFINKYIKHLNS